jgi:hypothetical protein
LRYSRRVAEERLFVVLLRGGSAQFTKRRIAYVRNLVHGAAGHDEGLGVTLNEEAVKAHMQPGTGYFAPTPEWGNERSADHLWSMAPAWLYESKA